jgi:hypothetical protein
MYVVESVFEILKSSNSCESNSSKELFYSNTDLIKSNRTLTIYMSNKWIRIHGYADNKPRSFHDENLFGFFANHCNVSSTVKYLYLGLNRLLENVDGSGMGICGANISIMNCQSNNKSDMDINIEQMKYEQPAENQRIKWLHELNYFQPGLEHLACSGEGVVKLEFEPHGTRRIARFDLTFGGVVSGFTFNIGDSPTNNAYGGDDGSTSNSAELHSNDNRFYAWVVSRFAFLTSL